MLTHTLIKSLEIVCLKGEGRLNLLTAKSSYTKHSFVFIYKSFKLFEFTRSLRRDEEAKTHQLQFINTAPFMSVQTRPQVKVKLIFGHQVLFMMTWGKRGEFQNNVQFWLYIKASCFVIEPSHPFRVGFGLLRKCRVDFGWSKETRVCLMSIIDEVNIC